MFSRLPTLEDAAVHIANRFSQLCTCTEGRVCEHPVFQMLPRWIANSGTYPMAEPLWEQFGGGLEGLTAPKNYVQ